MVPMFTCGLLRSNFSLAIASSAPQYKFTKSKISQLSRPDSCTTLAAVLLDDFFRQRCGQFRVMRKMHGERRAALRTAAQVRGITKHLRQRNFHADHVASRAS